MDTKFVLTITVFIFYYISGEYLGELESIQVRKDL